MATSESETKKETEATTTSDPNLPIESIRSLIRVSWMATFELETKQKQPQHPK